MIKKIIYLLFPALRLIKIKRDYPELGAHFSVIIIKDGIFKYGKNCNVDSNCRVRIETGATLKLGDNCYLGKDVELTCERNQKLLIGNNVTIQHRSSLFGEITVGSHTLIGPGAFMSSGQHFYSYVKELPISIQDKMSKMDLDIETSKPIVIGEDCWIGVNSVIMKGITIGRGAIIGANSLVTKDVAPYSIMLGNPSRPIGSRLPFDPPKQIIGHERNHFPYFYQGFDQQEFGTGRHAEKSFEIYLGGQNEKTRLLTLACKKLVNEEVLLYFGSQKIKLSNEVDSYNFEVPALQGPSFKFSLGSNSTEAYLITITLAQISD